MRNITADRDRLNIRRRLSIDERHFVYLGHVKIAQVDPGAGTLQFVNPKHKATDPAPRMVEIAIPDLIEQLSRLIG